MLLYWTPNISIRSPVPSITPEISLALVLLALQGVVPIWYLTDRLALFWHQNVDWRINDGGTGLAALIDMR